MQTDLRLVDSRRVVLGGRCGHRGVYVEAEDVTQACCRCKCGPPFCLGLPGGKVICKECQRHRAEIQDSRWRIRKSWLTPYLDQIKLPRTKYLAKREIERKKNRQMAFDAAEIGLFDFSI